MVSKCTKNHIIFIQLNEIILAIIKLSLLLKKTKKLIWNKHTQCVCVLNYWFLLLLLLSMLCPPPPLPPPPPSLLQCFFCCCIFKHMNWSMCECFVLCRSMTATHYKYTHSYTTSASKPLPLAYRHIVFYMPHEHMWQKMKSSQAKHAIFGGTDGFSHVWKNKIKKIGLSCAFAVEKLE